MGQKTRLSTIQAKYWGTDQCIYENSYSEVHIAKINKGGYCSKHRHNSKYNRFHVVSGKLEVITYNTSGEEKIILGPGQTTDLIPGLYHRFIAHEDTILIEVYWISELDINDIEREDSGGIADTDG